MSKVTPIIASIIAYRRNFRSAVDTAISFLRPLARFPCNLSSILVRLAVILLAGKIVFLANTADNLGVEAAKGGSNIGFGVTAGATPFGVPVFESMFGGVGRLKAPSLRESL